MWSSLSPPHIPPHPKVGVDFGPSARLHHKQAPQKAINNLRPLDPDLLAAAPDARVGSPVAPSISARRASAPGGPDTGALCSCQPCCPSVAKLMSLWKQLIKPGSRDASVSSATLSVWLAGFGGARQRHLTAGAGDKWAFFNVAQLRVIAFLGLAGCVVVAPEWTHETVNCRVDQNCVLFDQDFCQHGYHIISKSFSYLFFFVHTNLCPSLCCVTARALDR